MRYVVMHINLLMIEINDEYTDHMDPECLGINVSCFNKTINVMQCHVHTHNIYGVYKLRDHIKDCMFCQNAVRSRNARGASDWAALCGVSQSG